MPTYERRTYLSLLINENTKKSEMMEEQREKATKKNAKGERTTRVSGETLKSQLKNGKIPNQ